MRQAEDWIMAYHPCSQAAPGESMAAYADIRIEESSSGNERANGRTLREPLKALPQSDEVHRMPEQDL